jgi:formate dehydrogenase major subunit
MIRAKVSDPWREVSWDEAIGHAASEFKRIQAAHGKNSIGGITSSRCTKSRVRMGRPAGKSGIANRPSKAAASPRPSKPRNE